VVDASGLVAEDDQLGLVLGPQCVEGVDVALIAVLERGDLDGLVKQETIASVESGPIDVIADVQVVWWIVDMFRVARRCGRENVEEHTKALAPLLGELDVLAQTWERVHAVETMLSPASVRM
jgi:hypothetical protein